MERYRTAAVLVLLGLIAMGLFVLFSKQTGQGEPLQILLPTPTGTSREEIKVYVSGAVQRPGVYELRTGDRVEDALRAAGGPSAEADLERVNLALRVRDEQQVDIPRRGEEQAAGAALQEPQKINVNTAPAELLDTLPGIGQVRSQRIVESRTKEGPFRSAQELVERKLIPASTYEEIKDRITVQ